MAPNNNTPRLAHVKQSTNNFTKGLFIKSLIQIQEGCLEFLSALNRTGLCLFK